MGVKFSQLPNLSAAASDDKFAVLDVSENILTKTSIAHATTATTFGIGNETNYGHVKLSDAYATTVGDASSGIAASQAALNAVYEYAKSAPDAPLTVVNGQICVTYETT